MFSLSFSYNHHNFKHFFQLIVTKAPLSFIWIYLQTKMKRILVTSQKLELRISPPGATWISFSVASTAVLKEITWVLLPEQCCVRLTWYLEYGKTAFCGTEKIALVYGKQCTEYGKPGLCMESNIWCTGKQLFLYGKEWFSVWKIILVYGKWWFVWKSIFSVLKNCFLWWKSWFSVRKPMFTLQKTKSILLPTNVAKLSIYVAHVLKNIVQSNRSWKNCLSQFEYTQRIYCSYYNQYSKRYMTILLGFGADAGTAKVSNSNYINTYSNTGIVYDKYIIKYLYIYIYVFVYVNTATYL